MKFRFIGKPSLLVDEVTHNEIYEILQFEQKKGYLLAYFIGNDKKLHRVAYKIFENFNKEWSYIDE